MGWNADGNEGANAMERLLWDNMTVYDLNNTCGLLGLNIGPAGSQSQTTMESIFDEYLLAIAEKRGNPAIEELCKKWDRASWWTLRMTEWNPEWGHPSDCDRLITAQLCLSIAVQDAVKSN